MTLKKLTLKPGVNRENTRYTNENGWYVSDKVRFRQGTPEKIGGWARISDETFQGVCRALFNWATLSGAVYLAVGTNLKYYVEYSSIYYDITPLRKTSTVVDPFTTVDTETAVNVYDVANGASVGDFVTFSGATAVGGLTLNGEYRIVSIVDADNYTITAASAATSSATGGGTVTMKYQISPGNEFAQPYQGWGAGGWGDGTWGVGTTSTQPMRLWSQANFGEDLIFAPYKGAIYYWSVGGGLTAPAVLLSSLSGASNVPIIQNCILVSDVSRFVIAFGCNELGGFLQDPMLIRWSDQEDATNWTPAATNQAGFLRLSTGSSIITALQARQEILVWTDSAVYSMQYVGAPVVWGAQLLSSNISIAGQNAVAYASGKAYWMGLDKFYVYDGTVKTLDCDLRRYVFNDLNHDQYPQFFAGTNEGFSEVWWFYCSQNSLYIDRYVVYNYAENVWYYGTMARTAWVDTGLVTNPQAATYNGKVVYQEYGVDDNENMVTQPITAYIESAEFDIDDGDKFGFVYRVLPDVTFDGSTTENPSATLTLIPMQNSGSGYNSPTSVGGSDNATITRTATVPIEKFTGQVFIRVRGRQMILRMESTGIGVTWQLGSPRIDIRQDGRR